MEPAAKAAAPDAVTLVVEARDLDTDARSRECRSVRSPGTPLEQRRQLAEAVGALHPGAKLRSFADGAATFLDRQHLIVAFYAEPSPARSRPEARQDARQEELFA
jgi:hypothetical protein